jgi:hypothetical protein
MIEFLLTYGILIAFGLFFLFMTRGHGHNYPALQLQRIHGSENMKRPPGGVNLRQSSG